MALKTELAWEALHLHLAALAGPTLPLCTRNLDILTGFETSPNPAYNWRLQVTDGDIIILNTLMGEAPQYELAAEVDVYLAIEGEPSAQREALLASALETLKSALFPGGLPLVIDDKFDGLDFDDRLMRQRVAASDGRAPVNGWEFTLSLLLTASSPMG